MPVSHSDRRQPAALAKALGTIIPLHRWLLAFSVLIVGLAASPASAQVCMVTQKPDFGPVEIQDIVSAGGLLASTSDYIEYECKSDDHGGLDNFLICATIVASNPENRDKKVLNRFYQTTKDDSRIAWKIESDDDKRDIKSDGIFQLSVVPPIDNGQPAYKVTARLHLKVTYLERKDQDRVRPETYTNQYDIRTTIHSRRSQTSCPPQQQIIDSSNIKSFFTLTTTVLETCRLENNGAKAEKFNEINFDTRGALAVANAGAGTITAISHIDVRCTYKTPYTLDLDNGEHFDGGTRRMKNGDNFLAYQLFDATSGTSLPWSKILGTGNAVNTVNEHKVEGQLTTPIAVAPAAGTYKDTIVVTLTF